MSGNKKFLTRPQIATRYQRTSRTIARWAIDPPNGFPRPVKIAGRDAWPEDQIEAWERSLAAGAANQEGLPCT